MKALAFLFPGISMIMRRRKNAGILCIVLQLTLIGWIPAAAWACSTFDEDVKKQKVARVLKSVKALPIR